MELKGEDIWWWDLKKINPLAGQTAELGADIVKADPCDILVLVREGG